jgi:hypothetical protein
MSTHRSTNPSEWPVLYPHPISAAVVERGVSFSAASDHERVMDIYHPARRGEVFGVVIVASGYPALGLKRHFGRSAREFESVRSWCELFTAEGLAAVAYDAVDPATDLPVVVESLMHHGADWGIDPSRIGIFACSGNVPVALSLNANLKCRTLLYGFTTDREGVTTVADAAKQFGFANPNNELASTASSVPTLMVRAGSDAFIGLNDSIDVYFADALRRNLPVMLINHPSAPHAFDLTDDSEESHRIIRQVLAFVRERLSGVESPR